jgi:hypothetical protein
MTKTSTSTAMQSMTLVATSTRVASAIIGRALTP